MTYLYETKEWEEMVKRVDRQVAEEGGTTGSNMAEPLWFAPGPAVMPEDLPPEDLPPEEVARIKKEVREAKEALARMAE